MFEQGHSHLEKLQKSKNVLLVRDDVGKPKTCVRDLPSDGHAYGYKAKPDREGAGSLLTSWNVHKASNPSKPPKDFQKINKAASKRREERREEGANSNYQETAFGIKNKPSTPIDQVISNDFGNLAALEKHEVYQHINQRQPEPLQKKNSNNRQQSPQAKQEESKKEAFKLKKFSKVGPRVLVTSKRT